jgi:hypothetical protein
MSDAGNDPIEVMEVALDLLRAYVEDDAECGVHQRDMVFNTDGMAVSVAGTVDGCDEDCFHREAREFIARIDSSWPGTDKEDGVTT